MTLTKINLYPRYLESSFKAFHLISTQLDEFCKNTPGTRGWSRLRNRTLAVAKNRAKMTFFSGGGKNYLIFFFFCIYLLVMPKYWGKQIFSPKWVKSNRPRRKRKKDFAKVGNNNGHLRWRTQAV